MSQWADDSMTPAPIKVSRDKFYNEVPSDQPKHDDATPAMGSFNFGGNQYDDSPGKGGFGSYGRSIDAGTNTASRTMVDGNQAERGKDI